MQTAAIQRQYDEIIASHYDFDPQSVIGDALDRAVAHVEQHEAAAGRTPMVVQVGMVSTAGPPAQVAPESLPGRIGSPASRAQHAG